MTSTRFICHALLALVAVSVVRPALAEDAPAPAEKAAPSTEKVIEDLPAEQQEAVEQALEEAGTPEGTTVIVVPPPEAEMRKYDPKLRDRPRSGRRRTGSA